jgi:hypothetical protein
LTLKKENKSNLEKLIEKILYLKEDYKDLVFFYKNQNNTSNNLLDYNDDLVDYSSVNQDNKKRENILTSLIREQHLPGSMTRQSVISAVMNGRFCIRSSVVRM